MPTPDGAAACRRLFVYYRVDLPRLNVTVDAIRRLHVLLRNEYPGLQVDLMRRPELREGQVTLMESYAEQTSGAMPDGFAAELERLTAGLPRPRHSEWFLPL